VSRSVQPSAAGRHRPSALILGLVAPLLLAQAPPLGAPPPGADFARHALEWPAAALEFPGFRIAAPENRGGETRWRLIADVLFDFDRAELRPQAGGILSDVARQLRERGGRVAIRVEGHTDGLGTEAYNDALSLRRAEAVRNWLTGPGGLPGNAIEARGFGKRQPVAPNTRPDGGDDPLGRQKNRRVEIAATARR